LRGLALRQAGAGGQRDDFRVKDVYNHNVGGGQGAAFGNQLGLLAAEQAESFGAAWQAEPVAVKGGVGNVTEALG